VPSVGLVENSTPAVAFPASLADSPQQAREGGCPGAAAKPLRTISPSALKEPVLVIEDEVLIGMYVVSLLEDMGFSHVSLAANGAQALQAAEDQKFGLIVSDIILEGSKLNGIDVVASITRKYPVPVIFITAHAGPSEIQRISQETPRAAVMRKPVVQRDLHNGIAALVETWRPS